MNVDISDVMNELSVRNIIYYRLVASETKNTERVSSNALFKRILGNNNSHCLFNGRIYFGLLKNH